MDYSDQQIKIKTSSRKVLKWEVFVCADTNASVNANKKMEDGKRLIEYNICNGDMLVMY